ncbi:MAG: hypothetical protein K6T65_13170 [Peptococcaceae bacterium]|nr:hypothetical protein [Peptococcaceae bacterium]
MFDTFAQTLFNNLPAFAGLTSESARRMLSRAYLAVIKLRTGKTVPSGVYEVIDYLRRLADTIEFHAVLDETLPLNVRKAGAFVAAVVSMPTGSGKSFVAELAVSQAVGMGWCLYLAPTNALAE